jgi:3-oxoacyl-[acyl-carrier protein] reductase
LSTEPVITLITGTRAGIGESIAKHLLEKGHIVEGCSRGPADWSHPNYTHHKADVGDENSVLRMFESIRSRHGRLDVLINNAGIASMNHLLLTPLSSAESIIRTNFLGTFLVAREAAKLMATNRNGRIVNMATVATPLELEGEAIYAASKSAVVSLTRVMSKELGSFGITCNAVGPTPVETDLIRGVPEEKIQSILDSLAIKRLGTFDDVNNVIDFFIAPDSDYITGQVIYLGGA